MAAPTAQNWPGTKCRDWLEVCIEKKGKASSWDKQYFVLCEPDSFHRFKNPQATQPLSTVTCGRAICGIQPFNNREYSFFLRNPEIQDRVLWFALENSKKLKLWTDAIVFRGHATPEGTYKVAPRTFVLTNEERELLVWVNQILARRTPRLTAADLDIDFRNGTVAMALLDVLSNQVAAPAAFVGQPQNPTDNLTNLGLVMDRMRTLGAQVDHWTVADVATGAHKATLRMLYAMVERFRPSTTTAAAAPPAASAPTTVVVRPPPTTTVATSAAVQGPVPANAMTNCNCRDYMELEVEMPGTEPKGWRKGYFVQVGDQLSYYRESTDSTPLGVISIRGLHIGPHSWLGRDFAFFLKGREEKIYWFAVDSRKKLKLWLDSLISRGGALPTEYRMIRQEEMVKVNPQYAALLAVVNAKPVAAAQPASVTTGPAADDDEKALLGYLQRKLAMRVANFETDFRDGVVLNTLLNVLSNTVAELPTARPLTAGDFVRNITAVRDRFHTLGGADESWVVQEIVSGGRRHTYRVAMTIVNHYHQELKAPEPVTYIAPPPALPVAPLDFDHAVNQLEASPQPVERRDTVDVVEDLLTELGVSTASAPVEATPALEEDALNEAFDLLSRPTSAVAYDPNVRYVYPTLTGPTRDLKAMHVDQLLADLGIP